MSTFSFNYISNVIFKILSAGLILIFAPNIIKNMGAEGLGRVQILVQISTTIALFDIGIATGLLNTTTISSNLKVRFLKKITVIISFFVLLIIIFSFIMKLNDYIFLVAISAATGLIIMHSNIIFSFASAEKMLFKYQSWYNIGYILTIIIFFSYQGLSKQILWIYLLWCLPYILGTLLIVYRIFKIKTVYMNNKQFLSTFHKIKAHTFFIMSVISLLSYSIDNFVIGYFKGYSSVAEFTLHSKLIAPMMIILTSSHLVIWGKLSSQLSNNARTQHEYLNKRFVLLLFLLFICLSILSLLSAPYLIQVFSANEFKINFMLLNNIIIFCGLNLVSGTLTIFLSLKNHFEIQIKVGILAAVLNLTLSIFFIHIIGLIGPIIASNISLSLYCCALIYCTASTRNH